MGDLDLGGLEEHERARRWPCEEGSGARRR
jgi:hypothetical protein